MFFFKKQQCTEMAKTDPFRPPPPSLPPDKPHSAPTTSQLHTLAFFRKIFASPTFISAISDSDAIFLYISKIILSLPQLLDKQNFFSAPRRHTLYSLDGASQYTYLFFSTSLFSDFSPSLPVLLRCHIFLISHHH